MHHVPRKSLGQHFLTDPAIARRIVAALAPGGGDAIVEIGPGRGILTEPLAAGGMPLAAVEKDRDLAGALAERYRERAQVRVLSGDILAYDPAPFFRETSAIRLLVAGNIPFQITAPLIGWLLRQRALVDRAVLMMQREVADRIVAPPGNRAYGRLSVIVRYFSRVERLFIVRRGSFFPPPKVDAAVLRIDLSPPGDIARAGDEEAFVRLVRTLFGWRRKQVRTTLRDHPDLALRDEWIDRLAAGLPFPLTHRPEALSVGDFVALADGLGGLDRR